MDRQVVNPMPRMMESIVRLRGNGSTPTIGVGACEWKRSLRFNALFKFVLSLSCQMIRNDAKSSALLRCSLLRFAVTFLLTSLQLASSRQPTFDGCHMSDRLHVLASNGSIRF
jgi:hypothetical protein